MANKTPETKMKRPTLKELAVIFANYSGQEFTVKDDAKPEVKKRIYGTNPGWVYAGPKYKTDGYYALFCTINLKPLVEISDEDAQGVTEIVFNKRDKEDTRWQIRYGRNYLVNYKGRESDMAVCVADFLRSRGYALPYGPYSVEQLVEAEVYKIIKL